MQVSASNPNNSPPESGENFAAQYCDRIVTHLFQWHDWGYASIMFKDCPEEHLPEVARIFLEDHFVAQRGAKREDFN